MSETLATTTPESEAPEVFSVPEPAMAELARRVERYGRRAAKLGLPALSVEVVGEKLVDEVVPSSDPWKPYRETGRKLVFKLVEVHGEAPVVAGFTFVARIEHTEAGNIMSKAPGAESVAVPAALRDGAATCDHCNTARHRNDTFVLREDDTGELKRVGRNCLADFIRSTDAASALRMWALYDTVRNAACDPDDPECLGGWGSSHSYYATGSYLAYVSRAIENHGWTSRGKAYEYGFEATADTATFGMEKPGPYTDKADWEKAQPADHNKVEAEETLAWVASLAGESDYEHNLKVACSLGYVKPKNYGLVASAVAGYRRHKEKELYKARKAAEAEASTSEHFGTVDSRYVRKLTITGTNSWDTEWGVTWLYSMVDDDGNVFKWFSSNGCWFHFEGEASHRNLDTGDSLYFVFTVKDHGEWNGINETTVTRAKPSEEAPKVKWVGPNGEIFKTKKAMMAATKS